MIECDSCCNLIEIPNVLIQFERDGDPIKVCSVECFDGWNSEEETENPFICGFCDGYSSPREVDEGIGSYECHGYRGFDSQPAVVSLCCGETLHYTATMDEVTIASLKRWHNDNFDGPDY